MDVFTSSNAIGNIAMMYFDPATVLPLDEQTWERCEVIVNGHCYYTVPSVTFSEAQAVAASVGGYLAEITSEGEEAALARRFRSPYPWVGYSERNTNRIWDWIGHELAPFESPFPASHISLVDDERNCAYWTPYLSVLTAADCHERKHALIEVPITTVHLNCQVGACFNLKLNLIDTSGKTATCEHRVHITGVAYGKYHVKAPNTHKIVQVCCGIH
eukprot:TRINITY_DN117173_c0_g1_i1.p1 TRINITY_DN117173_c0_g1~~TRINITY_DN117173_c0_g1_i1.p1  ORF type:complete len:249 (-),score=6.45 TRINITY_DN117173_c0_g1_i1:189-836(-)